VAISIDIHGLRKKPLQVEVGKRRGADRSRNRWHAQTNGANLAPGRVESACPKAKTTSVVVERGIGIRLRPSHPTRVWRYGVVNDRTRNGKPFRILNILYEYSRECLVRVVDPQIIAQTVLDTLCRLCIRRGIPEHNGSESTAREVRKLLDALEVSSPWENDYIDSFQRQDAR
jgi:transposase InsO family protein